MTIDRDQYDRLHAFARKVILHDPEDLVQDAWLSELEDPQPHTEGYRRRGLKFGWRARHRADSRRRAREAAWASAGTDAAVAPIELLTLQQALARLPVEQRRLIEARFFEGREPHEIAAALGLSPEALRQRLHRALLALRRELEGERRRVLVPLGWWRRWLLALAAGTAASVAIAGLVCVDPGEQEARAPEVAATIAAGEREADIAAPTPTSSSVERPVAASQSSSADILGAAWLLDEYREGYGALMKEVQASFIECVTEHNQNPPAGPVEMTGKTVFRVQLRADPDTGVFAEHIETREDTHAARDLIACIGESLPTLAIPQPNVELPGAVLVVVERSAILTTTELDLVGMPEDLRDDQLRVRRIGRYLTRWEPPAWADAALADLAIALGDGVIEAGEVGEDVWATLRRLEDPAKP